MISPKEDMNQNSMPSSEVRSRYVVTENFSFDLILDLLTYDVEDNSAESGASSIPLVMLQDKYINHLCSLSGMLSIRSRQITIPQNNHFQEIRTVAV